VFAEYATVSRRSAVKIDRELPLDEPALFGCAVLTGLVAVVNTAQVRAGASVAVSGLGVWVWPRYWARAPQGRIISLRSTCRRPNSIWLGRSVQTHTFNVDNPDCQEQICELTSGGVEFAFELAGSVRALELAYRITRRGGTTVTAGLPPPTATFALPAVNLVAEERTVKGSYIGTCVPSRDIPRYIELYRQGRLPVDRLMSGRLKLEDINLGFDLLHEGNAVRQVVAF
jgi:alcohol dehydrogenase